MIGALALLSGVVLGLFSAALPGAPWLLAAGVSATLIFMTRLRKAATPRRLAALLTGMVLAWTSAHQWLALQLPAPADARLLVDGIIRSVPARDGAELRFDIEARILEGGPRDASMSRVRRVRLVWRDASTVPRPAERWQLLVRVTPQPATRNFAGPDTARHAFRDGVHVAGRVLPSALNVRVALANSTVDTLRARVAMQVGEVVDDPDAAGLLIALAVGLTDRLSADQWRVFNATGTTHLVAISGLHVTMFALVAFFAARRFWRWLPFVSRVDREPFAMLLGLGAAGAYALLSGFSVPAQRTWLMLAIFAAVRLAARHAGAARVWSLALVAVLLMDPRAPLSAGFWLSFVAVGVILLMADATAESGAFSALARVSSAIRLQCAILLALAPLTFAVFGGLSLTAFAVNLLAIPLVSFVLVPLVLAGTLAALVAPASSPAFFGAAASLYEWFWPGLTWAADRDFALWRATPPWWWFPFAMLASLVMLRRWPWSLRVSAACAALPLVFAPTRMPEHGTARISVFDSGRGAATLVLTHSHALLFDTGDSWNTRGTRLRQWVLPALDAVQRQRVDLLVLPSLNRDRAHGAAVLAFEREVQSLLVGGGWPASALPVWPCRDSALLWDGIRVQTFAAGGGGRYCALRISVGAHAILLGGDLDVAAERGLVARVDPGALASVAVLVSRNASALASAPEWIEASAASLAIATGGIVNSHSRDATLARWRAAGAEVLDTRRDGGIELVLGTSGIRVVATARASRYPFVWHRSR
ncbi:MAG TPA: DNA internalization-related competence protein ComEC/Rec2 [Steroidobacteraceae bacterium]|nr:DNA internalization-related competence protein ComEC/Rec2 [Steroidobacteraceae bacterium]